jgi:hypothetical protein
MPDSILDWIKKQGADFISRTVIPLFAVDDSPPTLADGEARPGTLNKTNGGINVHVANAADIGGGGGGGEVTQGDGDPAAPWYAQGVNSGTPERLATHALQGAGLPGALTDGGGVKVGLVDAIPAGANSIGTVVSTNATASQADGHSASIGATTDADSALTLIGRIKNLLSRIPAALVGGRFDGNIGSWFGATTPTVGQKTAAASIPVAIASDQSSLGADLRVASAAVTTSNPVHVAASTAGQSASTPFAVRISSNGSSFVTVNASLDGGMSAPINILGFASWVMGRLYSGSAAGNGYPISVFDRGQVRVAHMGDAPIAADATTDVWTRVPAGSGRTAATSGVGAILVSAGRLRSARASMTNANNVWIAFHNAATATTATEANMLAGPWNISGVGAYVNYEPPIAEACTAGCKVVAWTDATMTTIDTAATFTFYARAM